MSPKIKIPNSGKPFLFCKFDALARKKPQIKALSSCQCITFFQIFAVVLVRMCECVCVRMDGMDAPRKKGGEITEASSFSLFAGRGEFCCFGIRHSVTSIPLRHPPSLPFARCLLQSTATSWEIDWDSWSSGGMTASGLNLPGGRVAGSIAVAIYRPSFPDRRSAHIIHTLGSSVPNQVILHPSIHPSIHR